MMGGLRRLSTATRRAAPGFVLPFALGAAQALTFAPLSCWPLQLPLLAWFFLHLQTQAQAEQPRGFVPAWAFGSGWLLASVYWLFIAMYRYGDMPAILAALATLLFALFIGLSYGLGGLLARRLYQPSRPALHFLLTLPVCFALVEWLRAWLLTGFPWVVSGYAHVDSPLAGFAPLLGVHGVGWLAMLAAGGLALTWQRWRTAPAGWRNALALLVPLLLLATGSALRQISWSQPQGQPLQVRLLQGNIAQDVKFARERLIDSLQLYQRQIMQERADIIATPETAFPLFMHNLPAGYVSDLQAFARSSNSHLLLGIPLADAPERYSNSVIGISPQGGMYRYDKHHLVPFGEFIPPGFRWFVDMMQIPLGDFTPGAELQAPFAVKDQWVMPNICYEDLFGTEIAHQLGAAERQNKPVASILLNVSNLAWYGESSAIPQHLQISRMRALETARPMLRATNTGATAVIDFDGHLHKVLAFDQQGVLHASVQGRQGLTPYARFGNWPLLVLLLSGLGLAFGMRRSR